MTLIQSTRGWTAALLALAAVSWLGTLPFAGSFGVRLAFLSGSAADPSNSSSRAAQPNSYSLRWVTSPADARRATVEVSELAATTLQALQQSNWKLAQWNNLLSVYAEQGNSAASAGVPPMLGTYRIQARLLCFEPQFPLEPEITYRAVFRPSQLPTGRGSKDAPIVTVFKLPPSRRGPATVVQHIFPSAQSLPENLLKFYIHFSAPMSRGRIYEHIHLRDDTGKKIELPFLEIDEELWDPAMTRLTLFFDPGRTKRGVLPLEEVGPALEEGKRYTLVIDQQWRDGAGNPLQESFQKLFSIGPPDRDPPDPSRWKVQPPPSGTRAALAVTFPEPMDHALAQRVIQVTGDLGEPVKGEVALSDQERHWAFTPSNPWRRGTHQLVIPTTLEDLAGNNIGKPFEVDLFEGVQRRLATPTVKLSFEIR